MKSNLVDVAGGTFVVGAVSYATGTAYFNSYFRELHASPDLFTVSIERVFFEGGRQLLDMAFNPLSIFACAILVVALVSMVLELFGNTVLRRIGRYIKQSSIYSVLRELWWLFGFLIVALITFSAFDRGVVAGKETAEQKNCTRVAVDLGKSLISGCIIYKTEAESWVLTAENNQRVLINIPADKYESIIVY
ncbi:hypothetical protein V2L05_03520 [Pseudomonas alliivorans]|nr:hypothetical protein [Pseudomonas alliivorans]